MKGKVQLDSKHFAPFQFLSGDSAYLYWEDMNGVVKSAPLASDEAAQMVTEWGSDITIGEIRSMINRQIRK